MRSAKDVEKAAVMESPAVAAVPDTGAGGCYVRDPESGALSADLTVQSAANTAPQTVDTKE